MSTVALILIRSGYNLVIFGVIFGVISYLRTQRFKDQTGVYPWGVPPVLWAVLSFFIAIFGTLLSIIACATTKVPGRQGQYGGPGTAGPQPGTGIPQGSFGPPGSPGQQGRFGPQGWGQPGSAGYPGTAGPPGPVPAPVVASPSGSGRPPGAAPPPGWHPDPVARHEHRYWDGDRWTEHVVSGGNPAVDPI